MNVIFPLSGCSGLSTASALVGSRRAKPNRVWHKGIYPGHSSDNYLYPDGRSKLPPTSLIWTNELMRNLAVTFLRFFREDESHQTSWLTKNSEFCSFYHLVKKNEAPSSIDAHVSFNPAWSRRSFMIAWRSCYPGNSIGDRSWHTISSARSRRSFMISRGSFSPGNSTVWWGHMSSGISAESTMFLFSLIFLHAFLFLITRTVMAAHERAAVAKPTINPASASWLKEDLGCWKAWF